MAPHSSTLAWKISWMEEPGRLQSMGSLRVRHDWATSLSLFTFMHWRRKWQPTPVFLPGESQGRGSLVGCHLWGRTESDTAEVTQQQQQQMNKTMISTMFHGTLYYMRKIFQWTYLQNRNRVKRVKNKLMVTGSGEGKSGEEINWEIGIDKYILLYKKYITSKYLL